MLESRSLTRSTAIYGLSAVVSHVALVLAAPVYSRVLGPAGFGALEILIVGLHLAGIVLAGGLDTAAIRLYFTNTGEARRVLVSTGSMFTVATALAGGALVAGLRQPISENWLNGMIDEQAVIASAAALILLVTSRYFRELLRAQQRPAAYLANATTTSVLQVGLGVTLVVVWDFGITGIMVGYAVAGCMALVMSAYSSRRLFTWRLSFEKLKALLSFGVPLVWSGLAGWSLMFIDRLLLDAFRQLDEVGIYALAYRIAAVLTLLIYAFNRAWTPTILELAETDRVKARLLQARMLTTFVIVLAWATVWIAALSGPAVAILGGQDFVGGVGLIPIIVLGIALLGPVPVIQSTFLIHSRTRTIALGSVLAAGLNVVLNLVMIPQLGAAGAAWATLIAFGAQLSFYWVMANRIERIGYEGKRLGRAAGLAVAFVMLSVLIPATGVASWLMPLVLIGAFPFVMMAARVTTFAELRQLHKGPAIN